MTGMISSGCSRERRVAVFDVRSGRNVQKFAIAALHAPSALRVAASRAARDSCQRICAGRTDSQVAFGRAGAQSRPSLVRALAQTCKQALQPDFWLSCRGTRISLKCSSCTIGARAAFRLLDISKGSTSRPFESATNGTSFACNAPAHVPVVHAAARLGTVLSRETSRSRSPGVRCGAAPCQARAPRRAMAGQRRRRGAASCGFAGCDVLS